MNSWKKLANIEKVLRDIKQKEKDIDNIENDSLRLKQRNSFNIDNEIEKIESIIKS